MLVAAVNKLTLLDFPGKTAAIIFTAGCNMRCGYCHNSTFVLAEKLKELEGNFIPFPAIKNFLEKRKGLLDGVVISGGEPTLQPDLEAVIQEIKSMGFLVKLDTNGTNPKVVQNLLDKNLLDFIAMDIKTVPQKEAIVGVEMNWADIYKSIDLIMKSGIDYEFRSTIVSTYHTQEDLEAMGKMIQGAKHWALQNFRNHSVLHADYENHEGHSPKSFNDLKESLKSYVEVLELRG